MGRKVICWVVTGLLALSGVFAGVNYLLSSQQAIQGFAHEGYPQQLRVLLGMAKLTRRDHAYRSRAAHARRSGLT